MPRDGAGVFALDPGYQAVSGEVIQPSQHNPPLEDLAAGVSDSIARTGVTAVTADIPFGGNRLTGVGDATADADALNRQTADGRYSTQGAGLAASVAANALTISLKSIAGDDPTSGAPVGIPFRSATAGTGTITRRMVTAATSLVISSGSTLGAANATPFRLWLVAFDDAGTVRLGIINARSGLNIYPLRQIGIASATAEGGAGAADSAHVFYAASSVSSKAYTVLGYLEWSAGLATAGTWGIVPTDIVLAHQGTTLPSLPVQSVAINAVGGSNTSSTSYADITGATISISPSSPANFVDVYAELNAVAAAGGVGTNTLHQSTLLRGSTDLGTTKTIGTSSGSGANVQSSGAATHTYRDAPGVTSSTTYKLQHRAGGTSSTTTSSAITMRATEIMA